MDNNTFYAPNDYRNYLEHFGVKGMKWGVRRFQNADGSYTSAGKKRYGVGDGETYGGVKKNALRSAGRKITGADLTPEQKAARNAKIKKAAIVAGSVAATAVVAYAGAKYMKHIDKEAGSYLDAGKTSVHVAINNARQNHLTLSQIYKEDAPDSLATRLLANEHAVKAGREKILKEGRISNLNSAASSKNMRGMARKEAFKNDVVGLVKGRDAKADAADMSRRAVERALWRESENEDIANLDKKVSRAIDMYIKKQRT